MKILPSCDRHCRFFKSLLCGCFPCFLLKPGDSHHFSSSLSPASAVVSKENSTDQKKIELVVLGGDADVKSLPKSSLEKPNAPDLSADAEVKILPKSILKKPNATDLSADAKVKSLPKSSLKKPNAPDLGADGKGNVKWMDLMGKELAEVQEFEPSETGGSQEDMDGSSSCMCVIL